MAAAIIKQLSKTDHRMIRDTQQPVRAVTWVKLDEIRQKKNLKKLHNDAHVMPNYIKHHETQLEAEQWQFFVLYGVCVVSFSLGVWLVLSLQRDDVQIEACCFTIC